MNALTNPEGFIPERCNKEEALTLAVRVREYWAALGYEVDVFVKEARFNPSMRSARWDVRSDLVNGWPSRGARQ